MRYKKAGTVLGIVFVIIAVVISYIGNGYLERKDREAADGKRAVKEEVAEIVEPVIAEPDVVYEEALEDGGANYEVSTDTQVTQDVETVSRGVESKIADSKITEIDITDLGEPGGLKEEIMRVTKKSMVLLDKQVGEPEGKQLVYYLEVSGSGSSVLTVYVNKKAYEGVELGEQLKISYEVYVNKEGVKFPVTVSVDKLIQ